MLYVMNTFTSGSQYVFLKDIYDLKQKGYDKIEYNSNSINLYDLSITCNVSGFING